jgi:DNA-binding transcriptional LysR family regulator
VLMEAALEKEGMHVTTNVEFNSIEAIKQCVMASMGIAFLPLVTVKSELEQGKLVQLNWPEHEFNVVTQMMRHRDKWLSPTLDAFMSMARDVLCEREGQKVGV